jgi:cytochrome P450
VPPEGYHYTHGGTTYHVPAGTSIGMSAWVQNNDPDIFPDPREFKPSRWLTSDAAAADLDGYMVTFSKGTRACGGINLAWLEMYLALAALVMRYRVKGEAEPGKEIVMLDQFVGWFPVCSFVFCTPLLLVLMWLGSRVEYLL